MSNKAKQVTVWGVCCNILARKIERPVLEVLCSLEPNSQQNSVIGWMLLMEAIFGIVR
jgi:hypothetical protein